MEEKRISFVGEGQKIINSYKPCFLNDDFCFGHHGELGVLLKNVKFYFDIKPISSGVADAILQVILCNVKHLIKLCNLNYKNLNRSIFISCEKNTWQYYKSIKTPTKIKQLYLEVALSEYLLIENYKMLFSSSKNLKADCLEKFITESKECLSCLKRQTEG